jgi:hypothetical protein
MATCENCGGEGGWTHTDYGSRWDDYACDCEEIWEPCPDCGGTGLVYGDEPQQLSEDDLIERSEDHVCCPYHQTGGDLRNSCGGDLIERSEDIDNNDGELSPEDERLAEGLKR